MTASSFHHITCAAVLAAAAIACEPRVRRTPDDTIVVVVPATVKDLDPRFASASHDPKLSDLVAPGLTTIDQMSMAPSLDLAEAIEPVSELVWQVTLRPGLRFSDGSPLTSDDVLFSYESTMDPALGSFALKGFQERFARFEVVDDRRLRIHLKQPVATLLSDLEWGIVSRRAAGDDMRFERGMIVGAGPFRPVSVGQERVVMERNPHYHGDRPPIARIDFRIVRDTGARTLMLIGGSADLTQNSLRIDLMGEIERQQRLTLVTGPSAVLTFMMMHNEDPILRDVRVRRAIAYAIDRRRIIEAKFFGLAVPATGLLPTMHWGYEPDVARYDHDPQRAMKLLDEAGYPDPDGPGGRPRMSLTYKTSADQFRLALARLIAAQLGEVGIAVEVRSFEFHTFFEDIKRGNYQLASMQTSPITEPDWFYTYFHSSRIPTAKDLTVHNRWRYRNARVDELTNRGRQQMDQATRAEIYGEVQRVLADELPIIPLWHEDNIAAHNVEIAGYVLFPNGNYAGLARAKKN